MNSGLAAEAKALGSNHLNPTADSMQNLASRAAYDVDDSGFRGRLPYVAGGLFGVGMALFSFAEEYPARALAPAIAMGLGMGVLSGVLFGVASPWAFRVATQSVMSRVYNADPSLVGAAPTDGRYSARLPCTYVKSTRLGIGGVLFVGPGALLFVPHRRNLAQHRAPFTIEATHPFRIAVRALERGVIARLLTARAPQALELTTGAAAYRFLVPTPPETAAAIERLVQLDASVERGAPGA